MQQQKVIGRRPNKLNKMLSSKNKGAYSVTGVKGILAYLFRIHLSELDINPARWELNMKRYIRKYEQESSNKKRSSTSSNLTKALSAREMTWITLVRGIAFLGATKSKITIESTFPGNKIVKVEKEFSFRDDEMKFEDPDEPTQAWVSHEEYERQQQQPEQDLNQLKLF